MTVATAISNFNFDLLFMARSGEKQIVISANDVDVVGIGLSLLNLFLIALVKIFNFALGWLDIPLIKVEIATIWLKHLLQGIWEVKWEILSLKETSA